MSEQISSTPSTITIATTIAPTADLSNQQTAISRWLDLGFQVISVNTQEEIELLGTHFPGIDFVPATRNAEEKYGKPYIFFDDLLNCLKNCNSRICGIVNSDIHFLQLGFLTFVYTEAKNSFLFGSRIDVFSLYAMYQGKWYDGFDYFFFDKATIEYYPEEEFCIGLPWWDYWAVSVPLMNGFDVKRLISPVAFHVMHTPGSLSSGSWIPLGFTLAKYVPPPFSLTTETMPLYNKLMFRHLLTLPREILFPQPPLFDYKPNSKRGKKVRLSQ